MSRPAALLALALCLPVSTQAADAADGFAGIKLENGSAPAQLVTNDDLARLPTVQLTLTLGTEHDPHQATYQGPLLWSVLDHAGAGASSPRDQAHRFITVTGHDGYAVIVSAGEISPALEDKQVILADVVDGKPLPPGHLRLVIPGDHAAARSVRDVARLAVVALPSGS